MAEKSVSVSVYTVNRDVIIWIDFQVCLRILEYNDIISRILNFRILEYNYIISRILTENESSRTGENVLNCEDRETQTVLR